MRKLTVFGLIWLGILYFSVMFVLTVRIDYRLTAPGNIEPIDSFIRLDVERDDEPRYYAVYVMSIDRPTIFQFIAAQFMPFVRVDALPESARGITTTDLFRSGQVARNSAIDASVITAMEALGLPIVYEEQYLVSLIYNFASEPRLNIGDRILSVNGNTDVLEGIRETVCGTSAEIDIMTPQGERRTFELERQVAQDCRFGIVISTFYEIQELPITFDVRSNLIGGPSSGLMQTLYLYDLLGGLNLSQNQTIAGTGTIQLDGRVGSVGGIEQKIYTAHLDQVDVFFVPAGANYEQARAAYERLSNPTFTLIPVATFQDALEALHAREGS